MSSYDVENTYLSRSASELQHVLESTAIHRVDWGFCWLADILIWMRLLRTGRVPTPLPLPSFYLFA